MKNISAMPTQSTLNKLSEKLAILQAEMVLFEIPSQAHQPAHSIKHDW